MRNLCILLPTSGLNDGLNRLDLSNQLPTLLSRGSATEDRRVTIEMPDNFLQRSVPRLDKELPHDEQFEADPDTVENVVFPLQMAKGNGVDVLVEEEGEIDGQPEDSRTFCTDIEWQNLDCICDEQARPGGVVEDVVYEDHSDDGVGGGFGSVDCEASGADRPDYKDAEHARGCE